MIQVFQHFFTIFFLKYPISYESNVFPSPIASTTTNLTYGLLILGKQLFEHSKEVLGDTDLFGIQGAHICTIVTD
jgi:hypothetical protein